MAIIDIIKENADKKFEKTSIIKEADLAIFLSKNSIYDEAVFVSRQMGKTQLVGYCIDSTNSFREASKSIETKGTSYERVVMYKKKEENNDLLPWKKPNAKQDEIINYFRN